jgi:hypothetical protein
MAGRRGAGRRAIVPKRTEGICNGVHIADGEFQTRVGWERDSLRDLRDQINSIV